MGSLFGANANRYRTSAGGGNGWLDQHFSQPFAIKDNWNVLPSVSYISVSRYMGISLLVFKDL
jgi:hypothetical protein